MLIDLHKIRKYRVFMLMVALFVVIMIKSHDAHAAVLSGECGDNGDNVLWRLDTETGVLTISGNGRMRDYNNDNKQYRFEKVLIDHINYVEIKKGVTNIGAYAFEGCANINNVEIPDTVSEIGDASFMGCTGLENINIPENVTKIGYESFDGTSWLLNKKEVSELVIVNNVLITYGAKLGTKVIIPNGIKYIGDHAFDGCTNITKVEIPNSVISIGEGTFEYCSGITEISIPDSVKNIGNYAFKSCYNLESISFPNDLDNVGYEALSGTQWLCDQNDKNEFVIAGSALIDFNPNENDKDINVIIPDNITCIGGGTFDNWPISNIVIPESVRTIGDYAFEGCDITSIEIPQGVKRIGRGAFRCCRDLTEIAIPDSVTSIGANAFEVCYNLVDVKLSNNLTILESNIFEDCKSLTSIEIPESISTIRAFAFYHCVNLADIEISKGLSYIECDAFSGTKWLSEQLDEDPLVIINGTMCYVGGLTDNVEIPSGVKNVSFDESFGDRSHNVISIPQSVKNIIGGLESKQKALVRKNSYADFYARHFGCEVVYNIESYPTVALKAQSNNCYLTCDIGSKEGVYKYSNYNNPDSNVNATSIQAYEQFNLVPCSDGTYALQSVMNRKYMHYDDAEEMPRCNSDFIYDEDKLKLYDYDEEKDTNSTLIKFDKYNAWLCVKDNRLSITTSKSEADVFNIIIRDRNIYDNEEKGILSSDDWFNMNDSGVGLWNIQYDIGKKDGGNIDSLETLGYNATTVTIDNMECSIGVKLEQGIYDVIIAFQGTGGYGNDDIEDGISNITIWGRASKSLVHSGYLEMCKKLIKKESQIKIDTNNQSIQLNTLINLAKKGKAHFTILGHSMGGAIAQLYAEYLSCCDIDKSQITGRTFNSALAITVDDDEFTDWYNICVTSDSVPNGNVPGSINTYGIHRIGKTIWLYDYEPDCNIDHILVADLLDTNIAGAKHNMDEKIYELLKSASEIDRNVLKDTSGIYVINKTGVSSKATPNANGEIVNTYNEIYEPIDVVSYTFNTVGNCWYYLSDGSYIYSGNVLKIDTKEMRFIDEYTVISQNAPLRLGFSKDCREVASLKLLSRVKVKYAAYNPAGNLWFYVQVEDKEGWIYGNHLTVGKYAPLKRIFVNCPVNVKLYDSNGNIVVNIADDEIVTNNDKENVIPNVVGTIKTFDIYNDDEYSVEIEALSEGMMDYTVFGNYDEQDGEFKECKNFECIDLEADKNFVSSVGGDIFITDTHIYVTDLDGNITRDISEDGTEADINDYSDDVTEDISNDGTSSESPEKPVPSSNSDSSQGAINNHQDISTVTITNVSALPQIGTEYEAASGLYRIIVSGESKKEASFIKLTNKKKSKYTIPASVKIDGYEYLVTSVSDNAFKNNKKITKVTIGKNVTKIGKNAYSGCKNLKTITIKSAKITSIGKNAFRGIKKNATIKVPKKQLKKYKSLLKKAKLAKTVKVKK